jgi:hypothetical protein
LFRFWWLVGGTTTASVGVVVWTCLGIITVMMVSLIVTVMSRIWWVPMGHLELFTHNIKGSSPIKLYILVVCC